MKKFYVCYGDFGNCYSLSYCETKEDFDALPKCAERITRQEALRLARAESDRRRYDPNFSCYADALIMPALHRYQYGNRNDLRRCGRIWERI